MKLLVDFFPILLFFVAYKMYDIYVATAVAIAASIVQVGWTWWKHRRVETMQWVTFGLIFVLGGATLLFQDPTFVKWKPTVVNWLFGIAFLGSQFIGKAPILRRLMGANMTLPDVVWNRLNAIWALFFIFLGVINLYVAYNFDEDTWVNFKLFGMMGLTLLFIIGQAFYLARHIKPEDSASKEP